MKPTVLVATSSRWYPTARLSMALAKAGFVVDAVCPPNHPLEKTTSVRRLLPYRGLWPLESLSNAISCSVPDIVIPGDDLATRQLHRMYQEARTSGDHGICELITRSLGCPEGFPLEYARTTFMREARAEGIRVPRTDVITNSEELGNWIAHVGLPVVLKANGTSGGYGVRVAHTKEGAERGLKSLLAPPTFPRAVKRALVDHDFTLVWPSVVRQRYVVNAQAFVLGCEATTAVACWQGRVLAAIHFQVLRKRDSAGPATVVRTIENEEMSSAVCKMVRRLQLSGLHGFDFMVEANTGRAHLIEMNPRATQVGHLTLGPGRDIPGALYAAVSGETPRLAPKVTELDTIALFPQEWIRDPSSEFLQTAYHDVPWDEPALVRDCAINHRRQRSWYSRGIPKTSPDILSTSPAPKNRTVGLDWEAKSSN